MVVGTKKRPPAAIGVPLLQASRKPVGGGATSLQTLANLVVSFLGTGILGLPYAFRAAGWLSASLAIAAASASVYYCMLLLVNCRRILLHDRQDRSPHDDDEKPIVANYGDLGQQAFGIPGRFLTEALVLISYTGSAVSYLLFVGENLSSALFSHITSRSLVFLLLLPLELALSLIRSLKLLAPFSIFADACNVLAMALVIGEDLHHLPRDGTRRAFRGVWPLLFAGEVSVFCLEAFGVTLAIEQSMETPERFPSVLLLAVLLVSSSYALFGACGYISYGEATMDIITLNLPSNWSSILVKIGLSIGMAFTFPITIHPVYEILEGKLRSSRWFQRLCRDSEGKEWMGTQGIRLIVVVASALLAVMVPGFAQLISFMGGTVCAMLAFVLPAAFHLKLMGSSLNLWQKLLDSIILGVGLIFAGYSVYASITGTSLASY